MLPPHDQPDPLLPRPRLFSLLANSRRLTVVHGSRFAGKTSLVRSWLATDPAPERKVVFVSAPSADISSDAYWQHVATDLGVRRTDRAGDDGASFESVSTHVAGLDHPVLLVLDGVPLRDGVKTGARALLSGNAELRIIMTTRNSGSRLEEFDGHHRPTVIGPDELAFTEDETSAYFHRRGIARELRWTQWMTRQTGGLAALVDGLGVDAENSAEAGTHPDDIVAAAVDRSIEGIILADNAFAESRSLVGLAAAAVPLGPELVATLPGVTDGADAILALETLGVVEQPTSDAPACRFPEPVRKSLLRITALHHGDELRRARATFVEHWLDRGDPHNALTTAIDGEDWHRVLDIVSEHWTALYTGGFLATLDEAFVERIPEKIARDHPTVIAIRRMHRQFAAPRDVPVVAARHEPPLEASAGPAEVMMRVMTLRIEGGLVEAAGLCDELASAPVPILDELNDSQRHAYAFLYLHIGITYQLVDRIDEATTMFRRAHRAGAGTFVERDAAGKLALSYALDGAASDAQRWLDEEQRHPPLPPESEQLVRTAGMVAAALVALDRLDPTAALAVLTDLGSPSDREEYWAHVLYAVGQHALIAGTPADGLRSILHHLERYPDLHGEGSAAGPMLDAVRADLYLAIGQIDSARELVDRSNHPRTAAARARIHLLAAEPHAAERLADQHWADVRCSVRESTELSVIGAAAAATNKNTVDAARHLERAVALSRRHQLLRPFALLDPSMVRRIADLGVDLPVDADPLTANLAVFRRVTPDVGLTRQEHAVLASLVAGRTLAEIARHHYVSINTVKTQVRSLYRKLGVHSRQEAISQATRLGLVRPDSFIRPPTGPQ